MIDQGRVSVSDEPDSFVGRERELEELRQFSRGMRAVTLCGAGGIGKTRLLLRLLAALADDYPDGTWFVELGDLRQAELVVSRVATAIGVAEEPGVPLIETLTDALRTRRLLLALDNCEHLIEACASLCQRLLAGSPGLQVLATSREALRVAAEAVWQVPPLALPPAGLTSAPELAAYDAVRLFADRAAAAVPGFSLGPANVSSVVAVCRALDGLPLAIELAAARVRVLSVDQIASRLGDRFHLLTTGDRTAPPRQQTLRAAIDWSYDLLSEPEQVLMRRLSVFSSSALEMAEQVCADEQLPAPRILDLLAGLAEKSLVEVEPDMLAQARYRMLETIREYAAARLDAAGETGEMRRRQTAYSLAVAEQNMRVGMALTPGPWSARVDVFRRYDAEAGNVREVLRWCRDQGEIERGLRICTAISPCWIVRGSFGEGAEWLEEFLAAPGEEVPAAMRGAALIAQGQLALAAGDPPGAWKLGSEGLELCRAAGSEFWVATALNLLSETALHTGQIADGATLADEAIARARQAGDQWNEGYALGTKGAAAALAGNQREAEELAGEALVVMRRIDQQWGTARTLLGLGDLARMRRDVPAARRYYLAALSILREVDARPEIARCLAGLGRIAMEEGDLARAREHLAGGLRLSLNAGSRMGISRGLLAFATLAVREDRADRAVQLTAAVAALRESAHLPPLPGSRTQRYLDAAAPLGERLVAALWAKGLTMTSADAAELAFAAPESPPASSRHAAGDQAGAGAGRAGGQPAADRPLAAPGAGRPAGTLTAREREVVALIAAGRSNKDIAKELFISPATAARHVANILGKLGYTSRSQVAAWAASSDDAT
jgi:predicted ATPase/DNA-binding CsgD family transcriptional regulator